MREFVSIEWLTEIPMFKNHVRLVAGRDGINRRVTYVTVQEAPDFYKLIDGGEFVLSTWYTFKDDMEAGLTAIHNLSNIASGLCIKTNRFIEEIPYEYIRYADESAFPLFTVDKDVKFREIIKSITIEINMAYVNVLSQLNSYYKYLFQTALENGSADSMLLDFTKRYGLITITISSDLKQLRGMQSFQKLSNYEQRLQTIKEIINLNSNQVEYFCEKEYHIFPCIARGYCYGYLVVLCVNPLTERLRLYITQLVNIITIKWLDRQEKENDNLLAMLDMTMNSPEKDQELIAQTLNRKSIDLTSGIRAVQLKYSQPKKVRTAENFSIVQRFLIDLMAIKPNILYIWDKATRAFILLIDGQDNNKEDENLNHGFLYHFVKVAANYQAIYVGVGPVVFSIPDIQLSIKMAINSCLFKNREYPNIAYYKNNLMQFALLGGAKSRESDYFIGETIKPLVEHDQKHNDCIMQTLATVIESFSLECAARKQNMHINSIRYRLQKIKNICGLDFFNQTEKYMIITAYIMYVNRIRYKY